MHTSTFGGNSLACVAGLKAVEILNRENLAAHAEEMGNYFLSGLNILKDKKSRKIKDVRGRGLMIGVEFEKSSIPGIENIQDSFQAAIVAGKLFNKYNIITAYTLNNPHVIRFEPPLSIGKNEIDEVLEGLEKSLKSIIK